MLEKLSPRPTTEPNPGINDAAAVPQAQIDATRLLQREGCLVTFHPEPIIAP